MRRVCPCDEAVCAAKKLLHTCGLLAGEGHKAAKKRLMAGQAAGVAKVIGTSKLRTKYESHEAKRNLCAEYDLFLADERILPSLPKLLGAGRSRLLLFVSASTRVLGTG